MWFSTPAVHAAQDAEEATVAAVMATAEQWPTGYSFDLSHSVKLCRIEVMFTCADGKICTMVNNLHAALTWHDPRGAGASKA